MKKLSALISLLAVGLLASLVGGGTAQSAVVTSPTQMRTYFVQMKAVKARMDKLGQRSTKLLVAEDVSKTTPSQWRAIAQGFRNLVPAYLDLAVTTRVVRPPGELRSEHLGAAKTFELEAAVQDLMAEVAESYSADDQVAHIRALNKRTSAIGDRQVALWRSWNVAVRARAKMLGVTVPKWVRYFQ